MSDKNQTSMLLPVFLTVFIDLVGLGIIIPIIPDLILDFRHKNDLLAGIGIDERYIILGFLLSSFPIAQFFGAPILGALSDRFGRKPILIISLIGTLLGYIVFAIGIAEQDIYILFASRMLDGFTGGNIAIIMSSISDVSDVKTKTKNFGLVGMAFGLGFILGPYIGGKFSKPEFANWFNDLTGLHVSNLSMPFWFAALLCTLNILFVIYMFRETLIGRRHTPISLTTGFKNIYKAFKMPNLRTLMIVSFLFILGFNFYTQFFSPYVMKKFNWDIENVGDFFAFIGLCSALGQGFIVRRFSGKVAPQKILNISLLVMAAGIFCQILPEPGNDYQLFLAVPFIALSQGFSTPNMNTLISMQADAKTQGEIFGINQSIQSLGMAIPGIIAGYLSTYSGMLPIITATVVILLGWAVFKFTYKAVK
ncbi:MAG: MFS transporter [Bacteroidota bacterium]|nr:MFS transporter [Bacteroidota bacterium]